MDREKPPPTEPMSADAPAFDARARGGSPISDQIGRFVVRSRLGAGGMGIVYLAHDPTLERDVALKVIHPEGDSPPLRARLLREARALGKLSHPNVVSVHEAGTDEGRVFIVMDLISGGTLGEWLAERRRGLEEIVRVFEQAGRGLAAAHAAGLVHRDFKPANVLIAKDGTAHVTDFGLAALVAAPLDEPDDRSPDVKVGLTEAGALIGTPSYMAPEQHERRQAGPAADQFAFGVALYEALVGRRPYSGDTPAELRQNVLSGPVPPLPARVPRWLRRIVARALDRDPARRFPSMAALLAALGRGPLVTGRRLAVAAGIALAGVAVVATRDRPPACEGASFVASLWNEGAKQSVRRAFLASGRPYAEDTYQRLARAIDAYTAALGGERQETCEAMRAPGEQSQVLGDLRVGCLQRLRADLEGVLRIFARADGATVDRAIQAAGALDAVDTCRDREKLLGRPALPADPDRRAAIAGLEGRVAELRSLYLTERTREVEDLAPKVIDEARAIGYAPLLAQALTIHAWQRESEEARREALAVSARARDDDLVLKNLGALIFLVGARDRRVDEAFAMFPAAEAVLLRAGDPPLLRAQLIANLASVLVNKNRTEDANRLHLQAVLLCDAFGGSPSERADRWNSLAVSLRRSDRYAEAEHAIRRAVALKEEVFGPEHPSVGRWLINLTTVLSDRGDLAGAAAAGRRAVAILDAASARPTDVAMALTNLCATLIEAGDAAEALAACERGRALKEKNLKADHPSTANTLVQQGKALIALGRHAEALEALERALAIYGKEAVRERAWSLLHIARALHGLGRVPEARAKLERARGELEKENLWQGSEREEYHHVLGILERQEGHGQRALAEQSQALELRLRRVGRGHPLLAPIQREIDALESGGSGAARAR